MTDEVTFSTFGHPSMSGPVDLAVGPDGNLWFTAQVTNNIGRVTPSGQITMFEHPDISTPKQITAGPDGALWFTSHGNRRVGRVSTSGQITMFASESPNLFSGPYGIVTGPDGNLWFTADSNSRIVRLTPEGVFTLMHSPNDSRVREPKEIVVGPDGALWFNNVVGALGRITVDGVLSSFPGGGGDTLAFDGSGRVWMPPHGGSFCSCSLQRLTLPSVLQTLSVSPGRPRSSHFVLGPDGAMWSAGDQREFVRNTSVAATAPLEAVANGVVHGVQDLIVGPDGNLWFTSFARNVIGRLSFPSSLSGTVTDEVTGEPVAGAWVVAVAINDGGKPVGAVTGPDGSYLLGVATGEYLVEVVDPSGAHAGEWVQDQPLARIDLAERVRVEADGTTVDVAMAPAGRTGSVSGTVTDEVTGEPVEGAWVAVANGVEVQGALTVADGSYMVGGLSGGGWVVVFADPSGEYRAEFYDDASVGPPSVVTVAPGGTTTVDAGLALSGVGGGGQTGTISGVVGAEGSGVPVAGAWVAAVNAASGSLGAGTVTGADGFYELVVPAGGYRVEAVAPTGTHRGEWHHDVSLDRFGDAQVIEVTGGGRLSVDIGLVVSGFTASLAGTVTGPGGDPVAGAWVAAVSANTGGFLGGAVADGDGAYELSGLPGGNVWIVTVDPAGTLAYEWHHDADSINQATPVAVSPGLTTTIDTSLD